MLLRHSSRRNRLDHSVLARRLDGAVSYDRIAGYFRSSLFEVAGEAISHVAGPVRIICNSDLDLQDVVTAAAAQAALRRSWCSGNPEDAPPNAMHRYRALYDALMNKKIEVRVLPDDAFGLIHGKAGVVRRADGSATAFLGSVNESASAWKVNYELLWEEDTPETVAWVQEEFDALWTDARAVDLACCPFITQDLERIIKRRVIVPGDLKGIPDTTTVAAAAAVETPVYRREQGLWPHQKYFARLALERHRLGGARLVLADQVGLGKTIQLAMAALLIALDDPDAGPILVLAPKPLLQQWQDELIELLQMPSARWNGRAWIDENDTEYAPEGPKSIGKCPRRIGLVSQGLVVRGESEAVSQLLGRRYACVIVDESHRARRRNVPKVDAKAEEINEKSNPNNLMAFLQQIGPKTKSMLLATATPVQLHPVEAWVCYISCPMVMMVCSAAGLRVAHGSGLVTVWILPWELLVFRAQMKMPGGNTLWILFRHDSRHRCLTKFGGGLTLLTLAGNSTPKVWTSSLPQFAGFSYVMGCYPAMARSTIRC